VRIIVLTALLLGFSPPARPAFAGPEASVAVLLPNGGEAWVKGSKRSITWKSRGIGGPVKLVLIKGSIVFGDIVLDQSASGSYTWVVGDCPASGRSAEPAREYRIRVVSAQDATIRDDSNGSFQILPQASPVHAPPPGRFLFLMIKTG
jgi:hypothetical protein